MSVERSIRLRIRAKDEASAKFKKVGQSAQGMGKTMAAVAGGMLGGLGIMAAFSGMKRLVGESITLYRRQIEAETAMAASIRILGKDAGVTLSQMKLFASGIQKVTTMGDEATLELAALGASMGKFTGDALETATKAAIGFSKAFGIDAKAAMILLAKAAQGNFTSLSRYGIQVDITATQQEKLNTLLRQGAGYFKTLAVETDDASKRLEQAANRLGDLKEELGKAAIPVETFWTNVKIGAAEAAADVGRFFSSWGKSRAELKQAREEKVLAGFGVDISPEGRRKFEEKRNKEWQQGMLGSAPGLDQTGRKAPGATLRGMLESVRLWTLRSGVARGVSDILTGIVEDVKKDVDRQKQIMAQEGLRIGMQQEAATMGRELRIYMQQEAAAAKREKWQLAGRRTMAERALAEFEGGRAQLARDAPAITSSFMRTGRQTMAPAQQTAQDTKEILRIAREQQKQDEKRNADLSRLVELFEETGIVVPGQAA